MREQVNMHTAEELLLQHFDAAVIEVFQLMLGMTCLPLEQKPKLDQDMNVTIRFSGGIEGGCLLNLSSSVGKITMEALLGECSPDGDAMIDDAVGELGNMIVGCWKSKLAPSMASALLSIPVTSRNRDDAIYEESMFTMRRGYSFQGNRIEIILSLTSDETDSSG